MTRCPSLRPTRRQFPFGHRAVANCPMLPNLLEIGAFRPRGYQRHRHSTAKALRDRQHHRSRTSRIAQQFSPSALFAHRRR